MTQYSSSSTEPTDSSEAIKNDIERTRSDMSSKIDEIQERLNPETLKYQAKDAVRSAVQDSADAVMDYFRGNSGQLRETVVDAVKRNPVPAALIGLGLGWILVESFSSRGQSSSNDWSRSYDDQEWQGYSEQAGSQYGGQYSNQYSDRYGSQYGGQSPTQYGGQYRGQSGSGQYGTESFSGGQYSGPYGSEQSSGQASGQSSGQYGGQSYGSQYGSFSSSEYSQGGSSQQGESSGIVGQMREKLSDVGEAVSDTVSQVTDKVGEATGRVQEMGSRMGSQVGNYGSQGREQMRQVGGRAQQTMEENPLGIGLAALAVGVAIGLALPATRRENQMVGEWRDQVVDRARSTAQDVKQRVQEVVEEVKPELEQVANRVVEDVTRTGSEAASEVKDTVKQAAQRATNGHNTENTTETESGEAYKPEGSSEKSTW